MLRARLLNAYVKYEEKKDKQNTITPLIHFTALNDPDATFS
jgi:hypothetical protein